MKTSGFDQILLASRGNSWGKIEADTNIDCSR